jgi:ABC-type ATPase involved in cell division
METNRGQQEEAATAIAKSAQPIVLELEQVTFRSRSEGGIRLRRAELRLRAGGLVMVQLEPATRTREITSMIQGLTRPAEGRVLFCGEDWLGQDYDRHFTMRSRIGRVFDGQAWIENLNVDENVTLACRHHGQSISSIQEQIDYWTHELGIDSLSRGRPAFVEPSSLQIHQWIRAFLGNPKLILLERPMQFLSVQWLPKLIRAIDQLRARGAAVVWFAGASEVTSATPAEPFRRFILRDEKLKPVEGGSDHE